jgi:hypothetical protein
MIRFLELMTLGMRCPRAAEPLKFAATSKSNLYDFETRTGGIRRVFLMFTAVR